jgi:hypothetical protein
MKIRGDKMIVLGDVFAVVAVLVGLFLTSTATILLFGLMSPAAVERAGLRFTESPWKSLMTGLLAGLPLFFLFGVVSSLPFPLLKILGPFGMLLILLGAMFGLSGLASVVAGRWRALDPALTPPQALSRAAMTLVGAAMFPVVGWFVLAPLMLVVGFGLWVRTVGREPRSEAWSTPSA